MIATLTTFVSDPRIYVLVEQESNEGGVSVTRRDHQRRPARLGTEIPRRQRALNTFNCVCGLHILLAVFFYVFLAIQHNERTTLQHCYDIPFVPGI